MIRSKYNALQAGMVMFLLLFGIVVPMILYRASSDHSPKNYFLLAILPVFVLFAVGYIIWKTPVLTFKSDFIKLSFPTKSVMLERSSISDIYLSQKEGFLLQKLEATVIIFNNGSKVVIWNDMYSNSAALRLFLVREEADKIRDQKAAIDQRNLQSITRRRYSGNVFLNFNSIIIICSIIFLVVMGIKGDLFASKLILGYSLLLYFLLGTQMNYFIIDNGILLIKNHYFPWKSLGINLRHIVEVDTETPEKRSTGLRVMTNDYRSRFFAAGSLSSENWADLLKDLGYIGIPVRQD